MELSEFVRFSLQQIVQGVCDATEQVEKHGATDNPSGVEYRKDGLFNHYDVGILQDVEFELALISPNAKDSAEGKGVFWEV